MDTKKTTEQPDPQTPEAQRSRRELVRKIVVGAPAVLLATGRSAYATTGNEESDYVPAYQH